MQAVRSACAKISHDRVRLPAKLRATSAATLPNMDTHLFYHELPAARPVQLQQPRDRRRLSPRTSPGDGVSVCRLRCEKRDQISRADSLQGVWSSHYVQKEDKENGAVRGAMRVPPVTIFYSGHLESLARRSFLPICTLLDNISTTCYYNRHTVCERTKITREHTLDRTHHHWFIRFIQRFRKHVTTILSSIPSARSITRRVDCSCDHVATVLLRVLTQ